MAAAILSLQYSRQNQTPLWHQLAIAGRRLVREKYDWSVVGDILWRLHRKQVETGAACPGTK